MLKKGILVSEKLEPAKRSAKAVLKNYAMKTPILIDLYYADFSSSEIEVISLTRMSLSIVLTTLIKMEIE